VHYVADKDDVSALLKDLVSEGDLVLTMGAGDIWEVTMSFVG